MRGTSLTILHRSSRGSGESWVAAIEEDGALGGDACAEGRRSNFDRRNIFSSVDRDVMLVLEYI